MADLMEELGLWEGDGGEKDVEGSKLLFVLFVSDAVDEIVFWMEYIVLLGVVISVRLYSSSMYYHRDKEVEVWIEFKRGKKKKKFEKPKKPKKINKGWLRDQPVRGAGYEPSALSGEPMGLIEKSNALVGSVYRFNYNFTQPLSLTMNVLAMHSE